MSGHEHRWVGWRVWTTTCLVAALLGVVVGVGVFASTNPFGGPDAAGAVLPGPSERPGPPPTTTTASRPVVGGSRVVPPEPGKADEPATAEDAKPPKAKGPKEKDRKGKAPKNEDGGERKKSGKAHGSK